MLALSPINPSPQDHSRLQIRALSFDSGGQNVASNFFSYPATGAQEFNRPLLYFQSMPRLFGTKRSY